MSNSVAVPVPEVAIATIPLRDFGPWAIFFTLLAALVVFFVNADQGAIALPSGNAVHEWVHDARHLLGYPCH